jgi:hypothetical protein
LRTGAVNVSAQSERMEAMVSSVASAEAVGRHCNRKPGLLLITVCALPEWAAGSG